MDVSNATSACNFREVAADGSIGLAQCKCCALISVDDSRFSARNQSINSVPLLPFGTDTCACSWATKFGGSICALSLTVPLVRASHCLNYFRAELIRGSQIMPHHGRVQRWPPISVLIGLIGEQKLLVVVMISRLCALHLHLVEIFARRTAASQVSL